MTLADGPAARGVDVVIDELGGPLTRQESFPLEQRAEALRHLIEDRPFGKVTLTVDMWPSAQLATARRSHAADSIN